MEHFLINSSVCLFVLWLFYKIALENTSWHHFKRFYLLGSITISLVIPFIVVKTITVLLEESTVFNFINSSASESTLGNQPFEIQWFYILMTVYLLGVAIMLWRFGKNLKAFKVNEEDKIISYGSYQLILRKGMTVPHSFFNRIFVSQNDYENNLIPKEVLEHEKAHLDQKHSLDILLIEALIVLFWFNPILYILRYSIKLNHEFLADRCVIQQGIPTKNYQKLILHHASKNYQLSMANTFHFPIIKKRFNIMKTKTSITNGLLRSLAIIPIITLLILSCGQEETEFEVENQQRILEGQELILEGELESLEIVEVLEEITAKDIEDYNRLAKKHKAYMDENNTLIAWKDESSRMQIIFNSMSEEQRANNEPWPYTGKVNSTNFEVGQIPPPPPPTSVTGNEAGQIPPPPPPTSVTGNEAGQIPPPPPPVEIIEVEEKL